MATSSKESSFGSQLSNRSRLFRRRGQGRATTLREFTIVRNWEQNLSPVQKKSLKSIVEKENIGHSDNQSERSISLSSIQSESPFLFHQSSPVKEDGLDVPESDEDEDDGRQSPSLPLHKSVLRNLSHISAAQNASVNRRRSDLTDQDETVKFYDRSHSKSMRSASIHESQDRDEDNNNNQNSASKLRYMSDDENRSQPVNKDRIVGTSRYDEDEEANTSLGKVAPTTSANLLNISLNTSTTLRDLISPHRQLNVPTTSTPIQRHYSRSSGEKASDSDESEGNDILRNTSTPIQQHTTRMSAKKVPDSENCEETHVPNTDSPIHQYQSKLSDSEGSEGDNVQDIRTPIQNHYSPTEKAPHIDAHTSIQRKVGGSSSERASDSENSEGHQSERSFSRSPPTKMSRKSLHRTSHSPAEISPINGPSETGSSPDSSPHVMSRSGSRLLQRSYSRSSPYEKMSRNANEAFDKLVSSKSPTADKVSHNRSSNPKKQRLSKTFDHEDIPQEKVTRSDQQNRSRSDHHRSQSTENVPESSSKFVPISDHCDSVFLSVNDKTQKTLTPMLKQKLQTKTPNSLKPYVTYTRRGSRLKTKKTLDLSTPRRQTQKPTQAPSGRSRKNQSEASAVHNVTHEETVNVTLSTPAASRKRSLDSDDYDEPVNHDKVTKKSPIRGRSRQRAKQTANQNTEEMEDIDLRLWHGGGPKRKVTDLTNLDVTLNSIEDQIINFRDSLEHTSSIRAVNYFGGNMRKDLTNMIDVKHRVRKKKSKLNKTRHFTTKARESLLTAENQASRNSNELADLEEEIEKVQKISDDWQDVNCFLTGLENLYSSYKEKYPNPKKANQDYVCSQNLPALVTDCKIIANTTDHLKSLNDQIEGWLDKQ